MSQSVFPTLPGLMWDVKKTPTWSTKVQQSTSGKELRASYFSYPQYKYTLAYEILRQATAFQELQTLMGFFNARQGKYDSFLFTDPNDNACQNMGFGQTDGSTTAYQLQRSAAGPRQDSVSGSSSFPVPLLPRWQALQQSGTIASSPWVGNSSGAANPTLTANAGIDPTGNVGAAAIAYPSVTSVQWSGWSQPVASVLGSNGNVSGETWTFSVWLRADVACTIFMILEDNPFTTGSTSVPVNVTTQWQRFSITRTFPSSSGAGATVHLRNGGPGSAEPSCSIYAWGAQLELGSTTTQYIPSTSAAVTQWPAFWPATGDGFEPVYDLNTVAQYPQIFLGGVLKSAHTDYTLNGAGLVTFTSTPAAGLSLSWQGSYYWRCRFDLDAAEFDEFMYQLWDLKQLVLVTVK